MTSPHRADPLIRLTDASFARPLPGELLAARAEMVAAVNDLRTIPDAALGRAWGWKGGGEEEVRYGFYRIVEALEAATVYARAALSDCLERDRAGDLIAPATAARWDLHGLLLGLPDEVWDAAADGEWTVRRTLAHLISTQRGYAVRTAWWQRRAYHVDDADLPAAAPSELDAELPEEETEARGTPAEVRARLEDVLDRSTERLAGLPDDRLDAGSRWFGFAVDIRFRLGRWSSHIREHTVQVEKTLASLDYRPSEVDRLVRLILATWGRAEETVYGSAGACEAIHEIALAANEAATVARDISAVARG